MDLDMDGILMKIKNNVPTANIAISNPMFIAASGYNGSSNGHNSHQHRRVFEIFSEEDEDVEEYEFQCPYEDSCGVTNTTVEDGAA